MEPKTSFLSSFLYVITLFIFDKIVTKKTAVVFLAITGWDVKDETVAEREEG